MEINLTSEQTFNIIKENLVLNKPFLALRYGDGESIIIKNNNQKQVDNLIKRQLGMGVILKQEDMKIIRNDLIDTINNTDLLGIQTNRHLKKGGHWAECINVLNEYCLIKTNNFSSADFHYNFLKGWEQKQSYYDLLLNNLPELFIISCRNVGQGISERFNINNVKTMSIPPEMMFEEKKYIGKLHYPNGYYEIKKEIQSLGNLKGKLLLYGAGFVGKIYGLLWKLQGGVAVDIGSVFDSFAGKKTRGTRIPTEINLTYKL